MNWGVYSRILQVMLSPLYLKGNIGCSTACTARLYGKRLKCSDKHAVAVFFNNVAGLAPLRTTLTIGHFSPA